MNVQNNPGYPGDFWEVKCKDNLIRDTMYSHQLWKNPYYGLKKVDARRNKDSSIVVPKGMVVAGGYAMYLAGWTNTYSDIDVFVMDKKKAEKWISSQKEVLRTTNCVSFSIHALEDKYIKIQVILRLYKAPTEIVHGFDLDCVGILWDGTLSNGKPNLWATERALYAHEHRVNWFDPARASPSYAFRLSKYSLRGYQIMLPGFDQAIIDHDKFKVIYDRVLNMYLHMMTNMSVDVEPIESKGDLGPSIELARYLVTHTDLRDKDLSRGEIVDIVARAIMQHAHLSYRPGDPEPLKLGMMVRALNGYDQAKRDKHLQYLSTLIPKDPVSILIMAKIYEFHTGLWKQRDYDRRIGTDEDYSEGAVALDYIQWIEQDPMAQVSSTFYPTPIQDLQSWYLTSPLVHGYIPPPPKNGTPIHFNSSRYASSSDEE